MTTKPKRKAQAKRAAPMTATKLAADEPKRAISEIEKLVARWSWLQAWTCLEKVERYLLSLTPVFRTGLG